MQSNWLDERISDLTERAARPLSRRGALKKCFDVAFKGSLIAVLGLASAKKAFADACPCRPARGIMCAGCPGSPGACPPVGYSVCKKINGNPQDTDCIYDGGSWPEDCLDGTCRTCTDCWTGTANSSCTCRSDQYPCGGSGCEWCCDCGDLGNCCGKNCCI